MRNADCDLDCVHCPMYADCDLEKKEIVDTREEGQDAQ